MRFGTFEPYQLTSFGNSGCYNPASTLAVGPLTLCSEQSGSIVDHLRSNPTTRRDGKTIDDVGFYLSSKLSFRFHDQGSLSRTSPPIFGRHQESIANKQSVPIPLFTRASLPIVIINGFRPVTRVKPWHIPFAGVDVRHHQANRSDPNLPKCDLDMSN